MSMSNGRNNTFEKQHIQNTYYGTLSKNVYAFRFLYNPNIL